MQEANCCCNVIWVIFGGFFVCLDWCIPGVILCITIIGIPAGLQCFKIGCFALCPFGKQIVKKQVSGANEACNCILNVFWVLLAGLWIAIIEAIIGVLYCITICGIPFGLQHFKIAAIAFAPFGADILDEDDPKVLVAQPAQSPIIVINTGSQPNYGYQTQPGYNPPVQPF